MESLRRLSSTSLFKSRIVFLLSANFFLRKTLFSFSMRRRPLSLERAREPMMSRINRLMLKLLFKCSCCHRSVDAQSNHILPRSLGSGENQSNKIELCEEYHGPSIQKMFCCLSELVKEVLEKARSREVVLGRKAVCD